MGILSLSVCMCASAMFGKELCAYSYKTFQEGTAMSEVIHLDDRFWI